LYAHSGVVYINVLSFDKTHLALGKEYMKGIKGNGYEMKPFTFNSSFKIQALISLTGVERSTISMRNQVSTDYSI